MIDSINESDRIHRKKKVSSSRIKAKRVKRPKKSTRVKKFRSQRGRKKPQWQSSQYVTMKYDFNCPLQWDKALQELEQMQNEKVFEQKPSEMWAEIEHD